jgi:hypothetical protein
LTGFVFSSIDSSKLSFVSVYLKNKSIGTVTNESGEFSLFLKELSIQDTIIFSYVGFQEYKLPVTQIKSPNSYTIFLKIKPYELKEIAIFPFAATDLLKSALRKIPFNYSKKPYIVNGFYRQLIMQDTLPTKVSEANFSAYRYGLDDPKEEDLLKVFNGNFSPDYGKYKFNLLGGPTQLFSNGDRIRKNSSFLDSTFQKYKYEISGLSIIGNREVYIVQFYPKEYGMEILYEGKMYIDKSTLGFAGFDFHIPSSILNKIISTKQKVRVSKEDTIQDTWFKELERSVKIDYLNYHGLWYLSFVDYNSKVSFTLDNSNQSYTYLINAKIVANEILTGGNLKKFTKSELYNPLIDISNHCCPIKIIANFNRTAYLN